jgi:BirA family transcriptional regulator, biotin operon repressor / biotin---[acetyl-CoA-carboxylase] ligase
VTRRDTTRPGVDTRRDTTHGVGERPSGPLVSRRERFRSVASTNDVVRGWLIGGTPEVCLAVADEQTAGRGRSGRSWVAPDGAALLLSLGFRPSYLPADRLWRLAAIVSLAMADAAEEVAGLAVGKLRLKWPNDLVVDAPRNERGGAAPGPSGSTGVLKVAGILGETEGIGGDDPIAIVGIGTNAGWRRADFPSELSDSMTSLAELSGGRPFEREGLLEAFLEHLEPRLLALRDGHFDVAGWHDRQITTGRMVRLVGSGGAVEEVRAVGVDGASGALLVEDPGTPGREREVLAGEIVHIRLAGGAGDVTP